MKIFFLATMDCEPIRSEVPEAVRDISMSGPRDHKQSETAIKRYAEICASFDLPVTFFVHPEIAVQHRQLLLDLSSRGACLGLHLHPYKLLGSSYDADLGAYSGEEQRRMIAAAAEAWKEALGERPLYFRGGYFSANDATFEVLTDLGFEGGSLSIPGRVLPQHHSVWAGAPDYPHRANTVFRLLTGSSSFIEVPVSVDYRRPVSKGAAGEVGCEWPYLAADRYDHGSVARNILERFQRENPVFPIFVIDVHNDQDMDDPLNPAVQNLRTAVDAVFVWAGRHQLAVHGLTLDELCRRYRREEV